MSDAFVMQVIVVQLVICKNVLLEQILWMAMEMKLVVIAQVVVCVITKMEHVDASQDSLAQNVNIKQLFFKLFDVVLILCVMCSSSLFI